ncbi:uncharacterized protein LOC110056952 [Orbicella faveolata]|uniref:uncharacterized protein LOC110056952 n=1 Tax=Orbicella faveolata TaxID=48498 RepID=UPI0009E2C49D|nr:uncharacterized protein LOC110056952 [Orbicella faveolata]
MKQQKNIGPMREASKSWSAKRKLVLESATDENKPPSKCQTRGAKAAMLQEESVPHGTRLIDLDVFHQNIKQCHFCHSGPLSFCNVKNEIQHGLAGTFLIPCSFCGKTNEI